MTRKFMVYEIINPHDPCSIEAASDAVAGVVVMILGEGQFGCTREDGTSIPTMMLGDSDHALDLALDGCGVDRLDEADANDRLSKFIETRSIEVAEVLESFLYADTEMRKYMLEHLVRSPEAYGTWNASQPRSSSYDLGAKALKFAQRIRARHAAAQEVQHGR